MKKIFALILITSGFKAYAQDSLKTFNDERNRVKLTGMEVLGSWAVANIAVGTVGYYKSSGETRSFHQMNIIWNIANLGIATAGYFGTKADGKKQLNAVESLKDQKKTETLFLINGGLDLAYIGSGIYLKTRGDHKDSDRLKGYGSSVILQGAFLLIFDSIMYSSEKHTGSKLRHFLEKNPVTFDGQKVGMVFRL